MRRRDGCHWRCFPVRSESSHSSVITRHRCNGCGERREWRGASLAGSRLQASRPWRRLSQREYLAPRFSGCARFNYRESDCQSPNCGYPPSLQAIFALLPGQVPRAPRCQWDPRDGSTHSSQTDFSGRSLAWYICCAILSGELPPGNMGSESEKNVRCSDQF